MEQKASLSTSRIQHFLVKRDRYLEGFDVVILVHGQLAILCKQLHSDVKENTKQNMIINQ